MFSALPDDSILNEGKPYTFTYDSNATLQTTFVSTIETKIKEKLSKYGAITVVRPFGSTNFIVTVTPNKDTSIKLWQQGIEAGLDNAGIKDFKFIESEGGLTSSKPGGLVAVTSEVLRDTTSGASTILWNTLKPLLPWVLLAGGAYFGFQIYLAKQMGGVRSNPKRKRKKN